MIAHMATPAKSPNAPTRRGQKMLVGRQRGELVQGLGGGVGGFELGAGWANPASNETRTTRQAGNAGACTV